MEIEKAIIVLKNIKYFTSENCPEILFEAIELAIKKLEQYKELEKKD